MIRKAIAIAVLLVGFAAPAWATGPLVDNSVNASASSAAAASATGGNVGNISNNGGTHVQTNTQLNNQTSINTNTQGQQQGQGQYQGQGQGQSYEGQQSTSVNFEGTKFDRYAPPVAAPGLTAAGTGVCLGSVSIGLSGPMAGASFGITKVDKGCEQRSAAALLYQMGYKDAAVRLLMKNDDVREAMGADAPKVAAVKQAKVVVVEPITVSASQLFSEPVPAGAAVQGN